MEPSRRGGQNAQKTGKNGEKMGKIWPKECEQGRGRGDHLRERMVVGEALDVVVEGIEARRRQDALRDSRRACVSGLL